MIRLDYSLARGFRLARPYWFGQRQNLQQDFCEPFRWLGGHAPLCLRRRRLRILSAFALFCFRRLESALLASVGPLCHVDNQQSDLFLALISHYSRTRE